MRVVDESGYFSRHSKESPLDKINNVEYDQSIWGRIFGFGDVDIQTAAELGETTYELIHHPKLLKDTITHAQEEYKKAQQVIVGDVNPIEITFMRKLLPGFLRGDSIIAKDLGKEEYNYNDLEKYTPTNPDAKTTKALLVQLFNDNGGDELTNK